MRTLNEELLLGGGRSEWLWSGGSADRWAMRYRTGWKGESIRHASSHRSAPTRGDELADRSGRCDGEADHDRKHDRNRSDGYPAWESPHGLTIARGPAHRTGPLLPSYSPLQLRLQAESLSAGATDRERIRRDPRTGWRSDTLHAARVVLDADDVGPGRTRGE
jgi:hypothetical protein